MRAWVAHLAAAAPWLGGQPTINDLHQAYYQVFPEGNRNAASHRWAHFILERAPELSAAVVEDLFTGFCAVSGSPVTPSAGKTYRYALERVGGGWATSTIFHCCWPCVCDTEEFIKLDTKTIETADGPKTYEFQVLGDPCLKEGALAERFTDPFGRGTISLEEVAPAITCGDDGLDKAYRSDHGYIIIGMVFDVVEEVGKPEPLEAPFPGVLATYEPAGDHSLFGGQQYGFQDGRDLQLQCEARKEDGYNSGMGAIFVQAAKVTPVESHPDGFPADGATAVAVRTTTTTTTTTTSTTTMAAEVVAAPDDGGRPEPTPEPVVEQYWTADATAAGA